MVELPEVGYIPLSRLAGFLLYCWSYLESIRFNIDGFEFSLADVFVSSFTVIAVSMCLGNLIRGGLGDYDVE